jgi:hypothetical protein
MLKEIELIIFINFYWQFFILLLIQTYQINHKFMISSNKNAIERMTIDRIKSFIREHNQVYQIHEKNHQLIRLLLFVLYYFFTPVLNILILMSIFSEANEDSNQMSVLIFRLSITSGSILAVIVFFIFTYSSTSLLRSAHAQHHMLYSFMATQKNTNRSNLILYKLKAMSFLKIMSFLEFLSGPPITVYCYNLFPLTSYELYIFYYNIASNFLLLLHNLVKK